MSHCLVPLQLWDIGGQPRFRSMWERYCRGVTAIVYVMHPYTSGERGALLVTESLALPQSTHSTDTTLGVFPVLSVCRVAALSWLSSHMVLLLLLAIIALQATPKFYNVPPPFPPFFRYMVDAADHEKLDASKNELHSLLDKPQLAGIPVRRTSSWLTHGLTLL